MKRSLLSQISTKLKQDQHYQLLQPVRYPWAHANEKGGRWQRPKTFVYPSNLINLIYILFITFEQESKSFSIQAFVLKQFAHIFRVEMYGQGFNVVCCYQLLFCGNYCRITKIDVNRQLEICWDFPNRLRLLLIAQRSILRIIFQLALIGCIFGFSLSMPNNMLKQQASEFYKLLYRAQIRLPSFIPMILFW